MSATPNLTVLDCTLRDGGYYNDWDFDRDLVTAYLRAMATAGIDVIEIGFRFPAKSRHSGAYAYSTDSFLAGLPLPAGPVLGVMLNASDLIKAEGGPAAAIDAMFDDKASSPVALVRIAAHLAEAGACGPAVTRLRQKGYRVGFNLMQSSLKRADELTRAATAVAGFEGVEVLYFADSLGNMGPSDVTALAGLLRQSWAGPLGIHTHDNMGKALSNSLAAIGAGLSWIDATVLGMGRGAGNARMEYLLTELAGQDHARFKPEALYGLALDQFTTLHRRHGWGSNLLYYLSALRGIHPTYVQVMQADDRYQPEEMIAALRHLGDDGGASYSNERLQNALVAGVAGGEGTWSAEGFARDREVLLLAPGPGAQRHADGLRDFIRRRKPLVLCLNAKGVLPPEMIDAFVSSNIRRLAIEADLYRAQGRPLVVPVGALDGTVLPAEIEIRDFGMALGDKFEARPRGCTVPQLLPAAYALAFANAAGASKVYLAGFDGFEASDLRQAVMMEVLRAYEAADLAPLEALTPTNYPVPQSSVYAPHG